MDIVDFLEKTFLFDGITVKGIREITSGFNIDVVRISRGECITLGPNNKQIGFVYTGKLEVQREKEDGGNVVLNQLTEKSCFGLLSVFSEQNFPTKIVAKVNSEVIFFTEHQILEMLDKNTIISKNIIYFMADRINFLNKKIGTFSGTHVEDRLFSFLVSKAEKEGKNTFSLNCKKCSEAINAGRASVYRALDLLVSEGIIRFENKVITLLKTERN